MIILLLSAKPMLDTRKSLFFLCLPYHVWRRSLMLLMVLPLNH